MDQTNKVGNNLYIYTILHWEKMHIIKIYFACNSLARYCYILLFFCMYNIFIVNFFPPVHQNQNHPPTPLLPPSLFKHSCMHTLVNVFRIEYFLWMKWEKYCYNGSLSLFTSSIQFQTDFFMSWTRLDFQDILWLIPTHVTRIKM